MFGATMKSRKYLIDKHYQFGQLFWIFTAAISCIGCFVLGVTLHFAVYLGIEYGDITPELGKILIVAIHVTMWLLLILLVAMIIKTSHRSVGPVQRFKGVLHAIESGNYDMAPVELRKKDEFKDLADAFNTAISSLKDRQQKTADLVSRMKKQLEDAEQKLSADEQNGCLEELKTSCGDLEKLVSCSKETAE